LAVHVPEQRLPLLFTGPRTAVAIMVLRGIRRRQHARNRGAAPRGLPYAAGVPAPHGHDRKHQPEPEPAAVELRATLEPARRGDDPLAYPGLSGPVDAPDSAIPGAVALLEKDDFLLCPPRGPQLSQ